MKGDRSHVFQIVKGYRGVVPKSLLELLEELGLELVVKRKVKSRGK